ncbi:MAG: hypothetical protein ACYDGY_03970 [Acidimicrobiales bacterium]
MTSEDSNTERKVTGTSRGAGIRQVGAAHSRLLDAMPWRGPEKRYDILKEATIAFAVVLVLTFTLAILFSSPDTPPVTIKAWADAQPRRFTAIALSELEGTSDSATYGPPYNHARGSVQYLGPVSIQKLLGVHYPIHAANDFVLGPLSALPGERPLKAAISSYERAPKPQQRAWAAAYGTALKESTMYNGILQLPAGNYGPLGTLFRNLLGMARSGALDSQLISHSSFYTSNYTKPILFIGDSWKAQHDSSYWGHLVVAQHLRSSQWGVMNETGSWPGQPWLWFYTLWYQVPPMSTSQKSNADILDVGIVTIFTMALLLAPFIPGLRDVPRKIPIHKLIWKDYYREAKQRTGSPGASMHRAERLAAVSQTDTGKDLH